MAPSQQGSKEEIRVGVVKPYLLRLRQEKGESAYLELLERAGVEPGAVESERAWLSERNARRILVLLVEAYGTRGVLRDRGAWATHPDTLGTWMRMLRMVKSPIDAYEYLVANARELTRMGTLKAQNPSASHVGVLYTRRGDDETGGPLRPEYEALFCAARVGELASLPTLWGLPNATVEHRSCLAKGGEACVYEVHWVASRLSRVSLGMILGVVTLLGGALGFSLGAWKLASILAGAGLVLTTLSLFLAELWWAHQRRTTFESHRIAALERGLELKGELGGAPVGDLVGTVLGGKYRISGKLGAGGIGMVYMATHVALGNEVAIKVLRGAAAKDGGEIARLRREAYIQTHVEHRNVARVLDLDQMPDGSLYVVMERLHGRTLADKIGREGLLAPGLALRVFADVCHGLSAVHQKGVVHRDLKPGNIFLCDDGSTKVLDFGMSKLASAEALTQEGYTLGTPEYMAPEQCIGATVEPRTDLYSLGVVIYEAVAGQLPISSANRRELLDLHQRKIPPSMRSVRPDLPIPEALDRAVMQCLAKKMADRPPSAAALAALLEAISTEDLPMAYPKSMPRRRIEPISVLPPPETMPHVDTSPGHPAPPFTRESSARRSDGTDTDEILSAPQQEKQA